VKRFNLNFTWTIFKFMRDAFKIKGKEINYMGTKWVINDFYYVPNNPNLYVELYDGKSRMNVIIDLIKDLITKQ